MTTPEDPASRANRIIRDGEQRIQRAWFRSLTRWMDRTRPQVLGSGQVQPQNVGQNAAFWGELMTSEVVPESASLYRRIRNRITQRDEPITDPDAAQFLNEVGNRLKRVPDEVYSLIVREIETGIALGESVPDMTARVQQVLTASATPYWKNRAVTVARTECLPGDTVVDGARATAVYRRPYSGQWVEVVTESDRKISGTPNHPVLTQRGWVGLGQLTETDRLICDSRRVQESGASTDEHVHQRPATLAEIFDATSAVVIAERDATAQPDFHGDGVKGYVDVLRSYGVLSVGCFAPVTEGRVNLVLPPPDLERVLLDVDRAPFQRGVPVDSCVCFGGGADGPAPIADGPEQSLLAAPEFGSERDGRFPGTVPLRYLVDGQIVASVCSEPGTQQDGPCVLHGSGDARALDGPKNSVRAEPGLLCHCSVAETGQIELDSVARIVVTEWSGHVYNLTTVDGYFSVNDGVYTGNTLAAVNAGAYAGAVREAEARGDPAPFKAWLSTSDQRTRPDHVEADGQRTLLTSPFIVGGAQLQYPGDPRGPANQTIMCRCTLLPIVLGETLDWTDRQEP